MDNDRLFEDYQKIQRNTFWVYFWDEIEKIRRDNLESLGGGEKLSNDKLRILQGINIGLKRAQSKPSQLEERIRGKSETTPEGD